MKRQDHGEQKQTMRRDSFKKNQLMRTWKEKSLETRMKLRNNMKMTLLRETGIKESNCRHIIMK